MVLTYNEAENIASCLESLAWADDIILVDSGSTDHTADVARRVRPDARVFVHPFADFGQQRNWALDNTSPRHPWILFLDADEHSDDEFAAAVRAAVAQGDAAGYYLTYRNIFLGRWLKRSTFYPSWQLRLLRHGKVRFRREGHGQREVTSEPLAFVHAPYNHYPFRGGIERWLARHNRYSSEECDLVFRLRAEPLHLADLLRRDALVRRRCLKRLAARLWFRPACRFVYTYLLRGGFLDGLAGYIYCRLMAQYEFQLWAKLVERRHQ